MAASSSSVMSTARLNVVGSDEENEDIHFDYGELNRRAGRYSIDALCNRHCPVSAPDRRI